MSDSDDLSMSESEVGRLAVSIEKEMFNLYMNTDSKYKNKYRSLMFNLKDPKNKVSNSPVSTPVIFTSSGPPAKRGRRGLKTRGISYEQVLNAFV